MTVVKKLDINLAGRPLEPQRLSDAPGIAENARLPLAHSSVPVVMPELTM